MFVFKINNLQNTRKSGGNTARGRVKDPTLPGSLPEVRIDDGEVEVGAASPRLGVHLLDQPGQLLQGGVHPCVDLQLVLRRLTCGNDVVTRRFKVISEFGPNSVSTPLSRPKKRPMLG